MTILIMVIIVIIVTIIIIVIIIHCLVWYLIEIIVIIVIIDVLVIVDYWTYWLYLGWIRLVLKSFMSLTTRNRFCTSYRFSLSLENCLLYQQATRGQFHTTCATTFSGRQATAGRVPATDAGYGLSTRGLGWSHDMLRSGRFERLSCHMERGSMWTR